MEVQGSTRLRLPRVLSMTAKRLDFRRFHNRQTQLCTYTYYAVGHATQRRVSTAGWYSATMEKKGRSFSCSFRISSSLCDGWNVTWLSPLLFTFIFPPNTFSLKALWGKNEMLALGILLTLIHKRTGTQGFALLPVMGRSRFWKKTKLSFPAI